MKDYFKELLTKIFTAQMRKIIVKHKPKIICVVGSVGKTTTKMAIATVLKEKYKVQVQEGGYNTPISVPFIFIGRPMPALYNPFGWVRAWWQGQKVLQKPYPYDVVIVELGTDAPGDIGVFKDLLEADIGVVTAISEEHMQSFASLKEVAQEELTIAEFSNQLIVNNDDVKKEYIDKFVSDKSKLISFGQNSGNYRYSLNRGKGFKLTLGLELENKKKLSLETQIIAEHLSKSIVAAIVVADLFDMSQKAIKTGVTKITASSGRMQTLHGIKSSTILDDSYNASPLAVKAALETLYEFDAPQKIAVLGTMNELGELSKTAHEEVGKLCDGQKLDLIITIGHDANDYLADIATAKGCRVLNCKNPYEAGALLTDEIRPRAVILVKGSQNGVFAEEAIKPILARKSDAKLLVRQNRFWKHKKRQQFKGFKITG